MKRLTFRGAHYMGYSSDICRSFFIDSATKQSQFATLMGMLGMVSAPFKGLGGNPELHAEKLKVWEIVLNAQTAAATHLKANNTAASVDIAARQVISEAGYGYAFPHRLGHGIGIKGIVRFLCAFPYETLGFKTLTTCSSAHESPYLNKWNTKVTIRPGMTFTNEPGIYLEGKFGVRHEDVYLVKENGDAELLTGRRATGAYDP